MKKITALLVIVMFFACKNEVKTPTSEPVLNTHDSLKKYPENILKIFKAHGRLDLWKQMQVISFTISNPDGDEITTTNLKNRKSLIETPNHDIGFNGKQVWVKNKNTINYEGNAKFYYNLMFYFYAMPFVLADEGINYEDVEPLIFNETEYPGIKISYQNNIGESPDDEYIIYYDKNTNEMAWLAYTVTFFSKEKAKEFNYIKYNNWQKVNGLLLPETIQWYQLENNMPTNKRKEVTFRNVKINKEKTDESIFEIPEGAKIIE
ncbi:hypothetical protein AW14_07615 [Siansivirga zeaxanthinifaciens CC-SAMT-1]|uniref:Threonine synthase n=2 Tax=Siansivirga TaxID=1204360 RepID=A0A0C5WE63_9FLAO|nr:hypothetical protein AW14_07615 [Siansivirga zeaxanthinifaciens CC-SAMT-1]